MKSNFFNEFLRSEINDPPSFNKKESRFEREQRIRVGNVQTYVPGAPSGVREKYDMYLYIV